MPLTTLRLTTSSPRLPPCARPQPEEIEAMFKEVVDKWGTVEVLVNK